MELQVVGLGALGGIVPDLLRIAKAKGNLGEVGGINVLISMVVLAIVGAIAAWVADIATAGEAALLASLTAGFTGPEVISRLLGGSGGGGPESFTTQRSGVLGWWRV